MYGFEQYMESMMALWSSYLNMFRGEQPTINTAAATDEALRMGNEPVKNSTEKFMDELKDVLMEPIPNKA